MHAETGCVNSALMVNWQAIDGMTIVAKQHQFSLNPLLSLDLYVKLYLFYVLLNFFHH